MLKIFIYTEQQDKWVEESTHLLYHDLVAFIDKDRNIIYLWNGPKCTKDKLKKGKKSIHKLLRDFTDINFQIKKLNKDIPPHIKNRLENLLDTSKKEKELANYQYSHFFTIRLHTIISIVALILPIVSFIILSSSLFWENVGNDFLIKASNYNIWLISALIPLIISLLLFISQLIIAVYEHDTSIIIFSSTSIVLSISLLFYLQQGVFLFQFQEASTYFLYYIAKLDIYLFLLMIGLAIGLFEIPNIIKTLNFLSTYKKFIF